MTNFHVVGAQTTWVIDEPLTIDTLIRIMESLEHVTWFPTVITDITYSGGSGPLRVTYRRALPTRDAQ